MIQQLFPSPTILFILQIFGKLRHIPSCEQHQPSRSGVVVFSTPLWSFSISKQTESLTGCAQLGPLDPSSPAKSGDQGPRGRAKMAAGTSLHIL